MACRSSVRSRSPGDGPSSAPGRRPFGRPWTCPGTTMPPLEVPPCWPRTRTAPLVQQPCATCELEGEPLIRIVEIHFQQLRYAPQPVGDGIAVQVQPLRGLDDRALLVEISRQSPDRGVGAGRAQLL